MAKLVSKTYGEALFELAAEEGREETFLEEVMAFKSILAQNPDFGRLMNHPKILKERKEEVIDQVFKGKISDELTGFLHLLINKDRYGEIEGILEYFIEQVKKLKGIGIAYVVTAIPLGEAKRKEIEDKLLATTSFKKMEMHFDVDGSLLGGMVIRIGDRVVDGSVSSRLQKMQRQMLKTRIES